MARAMSLFSWPFSREKREDKEPRNGSPAGSADPSPQAAGTMQTDTRPTESSFNDVVKHFDHLGVEVSKLHEQLTSQQREIKDHLSQLQKARNQTQQHEATIRNLRKTAQQETENLAALQRAICPSPKKLADAKKKGPTTGFVDELKAQQNARRNEIVGLQGTVNRLKNEKSALQRHQTATQTRLDEALVDNRELKVDLENIKCTTTPAVQHSQILLPDLSVPLPDAPFILVIVDGDFYNFNMTPSSATGSNPQLHPATRVARTIKNNLYTYIDNHGLAPHCKLLVRVLMNITGSRHGRSTHVVKRNGSSLSPFEDFRITFSEFSPLFEFIDAGFGKERVDSKIHDLYHTFIPNQSCQKIFLALTHDNGFARLLEQYIDHPVARQKTCLISSGVVADEIAALDLETIEWPSVFTRKYKPLLSRKKESRREAARQAEEAQAKTEMLELVKVLGHDGYERLMNGRAIAQITKVLTGSKDSTEVLVDLTKRWKRRDGVRASSWFIGPNTPAVRDDTEEDGSHDGYCVEDGVD